MTSGLAALSVLRPLTDERAGTGAADADGRGRGPGSVFLALLWDPHVEPERRSRCLQRIENSLFRTHPPLEQRLDSLRSLYE